LKTSLNILGVCIDMRVVAALAVIAGGTFVLAPQLFWTALPVLAVLACPISMFVMMRGMNSMNGRGKMPGGDARAVNQGQSPTRAAEPGSREQQLRDLQEQLERVQSQQAAIARQIGGLTADGRPVGPGGGGGRLGPN